MCLKKRIKEDEKCVPAHFLPFAFYRREMKKAESEEEGNLKRKLDIFSLPY